MNQDKNKLLTDTLGRAINVGFGLDPVAYLDDFFAEKLMVIGTAVDEKYTSLVEFRKLIKNQQAQSKDMDVRIARSEVYRDFSADENVAIIVEDIVVFINVNTESMQFDLRASAVLEFKNRQWKIIHLHISKPDNVQSEVDTFGIEQWKQKADELEKMVAERTAELVAKNRELEIEAALEKVRSRSLAMHKSDELKEVVAELFQQLEILGVAFDGGAGIHLFSEDSKDAITLVYSPELALPIQVNLPYDEESFENNPIINDVWGAKETGTTIFNRLYSFEEKNRYFDYVFKYNDLEIIPQLVREFILQADSYTASFIAEKNSLLGANSWSRQLFSEADFDVLKRIAKAFEQAYIRFLDLQKAEAQAREAQIELSLEKVRNRSMAMHKSHELAEAASVLFQQIKELGFEMWSCGFCIWKQDDFSELWMSADSGGLLPPMLMPYKKEPTHHKIYEAALRQEPVHEYIWEGDELKKHYEFLYTIPSVKEAIDILKKSGLSLPTKQCYYVGFFKQGYLLIITKEPNPEMHDLSYRFTRVFEQTYTRFLDLQKAEAQAREAQIQLALERVRSKAMAMQKSDDLANAVAIVFDELEKMNLGTIRCGLSIINKEKHTTCIWSTIKTDEGTVVQVSGDESMDIHPLLQGAFTAWLQQEDYSYVLKGDDLQNFYTVLAQTNFHLPDYQNDPLDAEQYLYVAHVSVGGLYVFKGSEFSEDTKKVIRRFAAVFNLTYTRFNDLQIAEAHAIQAEQDLIKLQTEKKRAEDALTELHIIQAQLIQKEKLASLGELTAGIAHEIQNPLNFVNNFAEVSAELVGELTDELDKGDTQEAKAIADDLGQNLQKITQHGQRASNIVRGMLEHSRTSTGERQLTDLNVLAEEYLRLTYQGLKAKDKTDSAGTPERDRFNCELIPDFDSKIGLVDVIPQDMGRVLLNLYNNAFYAVSQRQKTASADYQPRISVRTRRTESGVEIRISDNGIGIPEPVKAKIFQPFFTTKPTGEGTGLGLSLSYDIVTKGHGGTLEMESTAGEGSVFTITLPG